MKETFTALVNRMNENPTGLENLSATYNFILDNEKTYTIEFFGKGVELNEEDKSEDADCVLKLSEKNLEKLIDGSLNATSAFMMGKLKIDGNIGLALKLQNVLKYYR